MLPNDLRRLAGRRLGHPGPAGQPDEQQAADPARLRVVGPSRIARPRRRRWPARRRVVRVSAASTTGPSTAAAGPRPARGRPSIPRSQSGDEQRDRSLVVRHRHRPDRRLGHDPEPTLRPEDDLAEVGAGSRGRMGRQVEGAGRGLEPSAGEQRLDPAEAERALAGRAGDDPAAERRELPGLRLVTQHPAPGPERRLERRTGRRRHRTSRGRSPRRTTRSPASRSRSTARIGWSPLAGRPRSAGDRPPTTLVAAAVRHDRGVDLRGVPEQASADLVRRGRTTDPVRDAPEPAASKRDPVAEALATGVADPVLRIARRRARGLAGGRREPPRRRRPGSRPGCGRPDRRSPRGGPAPRAGSSR